MRFYQQQHVFYCGVDPTYNRAPAAGLRSTDDFRQLAATVLIVLALLGLDKENA